VVDRSIEIVLNTFKSWIAKTWSHCLMFLKCHLNVIVHEINAFSLSTEHFWVRTLYISLYT
jgi:hypothetical protein